MLCETGCKIRPQHEARHGARAANYCSSGPCRPALSLSILPGSENDFDKAVTICTIKRHFFRGDNNL